MLSTDPLFFVCAAGIFVCFYLVGTTTLQTVVLSIGSFAIYATEGLFFLLLLVASCVLTSISSYLAGSHDRNRATASMAFGVMLNLGVLAVFKYKQLLPGTIVAQSGMLTELLRFTLPVGISFYTFHGISLVVDSWRNREVILQSATGRRRHFPAHLLDTSLYLAFFPQLVAGPITKGREFFPQIALKRIVDILWSDALGNIIVGMFLKRVVADNLNQLTLPLTDARTYSGTPQTELILMVVGYSAQIFADFAGYSLIAIGVAKLFGYRLPENFNQPYIAQSITDFWRRWHMSLSSWLREYLYISLGGNRRGAVRTYVNLLVVMGLGGLWHGADWKFAVWGLWHGGLLAIERLLGIDRVSSGPIRFFRTIVTFGLVTFGWLFFRLTHLSDIWLLMAEFTTPWRDLYSTTTGYANAAIIGVLSAIVALVHIPRKFIESFPAYSQLKYTARPYILGVLSATILMAAGGRHAFIYFQF